MRIHTNATLAQIENAASIAKVDWLNTEITEHKSRSRERAFEVKLAGNSRRRPNGGPKGYDHYAATWDQWGIFLGNVFVVDPEMKCWAYDGIDDFDWQTGERFFEGSIPEDMHGDHKFDWVGVLVTGASLQRCRKCTATRKWRNN